MSIYERNGKPVYREVKINRYDYSMDWGFTCGHCGKVVSTKTDKTYFRLKQFMDLHGPFEKACSEECIKAVWIDLLKINRR